MKKISKELLATLSAAFVVSSAPAISANIPQIVASYPEVKSIYVGLLTTIPSLFLILGVFLSGRLEERVGSKNTILIGLVIVGIFGTLPSWYQGAFFILFISRCLLGLGIGLFNRLIIQLISQLFQHDTQKKATALGLESAFEGLGGIIMTFGVGQLIKVSWHLSFSVYALAFIGVFLIYFYLPQTQKSGMLKSVKKESIESLSKERKINILALGLLLFLIVILFINYNLQITSVLIDKNIGAATQGSNMIAAIGAGAFIAGNLFGKMHAIFNRWLLPLAILFAGTFIFLASISNSLLFTLICSMGLGFSFRNIMPYFMLHLTSGGEEAIRYGSTVVLVAYNLGATFSPFIHQIMTDISSQLTVSNQLMITGILLWCISFGTFIFHHMVHFKVFKR